jgi:uncharacterized membrane protein
MASKKPVGTFGVHPAMVWVIRALALVGVGLMVYLAKLHFAHDVGSGSVCELGEGLSCEAVNTSIYSEVLGIPISFLGVLYFSLIFLGTYVKQTKKLWAGMFLFTLFNLIPSFYLSGLEYFVIHSICIFCEASKVLMVIILLLYGKVLMDKKAFPDGGKIFMIVVVGIVAALITWQLQIRAGRADYDLTELAQCMTENGVVMYGSFTCTSCARQRQIFGEAFQYVKEIECNPRGENAQTELCLEKDISHTPTFIREVNGDDVAKIDGLQTPEDLAKFADCTDTIPQ